MSTSALGSQFTKPGPRFDGSGGYMHHAGKYRDIQPGDSMVGLGGAKVVAVRHTTPYNEDTVDGQPSFHAQARTHVTYQRPSGDMFARTELSNQPDKGDLIFKRPGTKKA